MRTGQLAGYLLPDIRLAIGLTLIFASLTAMKIPAPSISMIPAAAMSDGTSPQIANPPNCCEYQGRVFEGGDQSGFTVAIGLGNQVAAERNADT